MFFTFRNGYLVCCFFLDHFLMSHGRRRNKSSSHSEQVFTQSCSWQTACSLCNSANLPHTSRYVKPFGTPPISFQQLLKKKFSKLLARVTRHPLKERTNNINVAETEAVFILHGSSGPMPIFSSHVAQIGCVLRTCKHALKAPLAGHLFSFVWFSYFSWSEAKCSCVHAGCFKWLPNINAGIIYGSLLKVDLSRKSKKIGYKQQIETEHENLLCKYSLRCPDLYSSVWSFKSFKNTESTLTSVMFENW